MAEVEHAGATAARVVYGYIARIQVRGGIEPTVRPVPVGYDDCDRHRWQPSHRCQLGWIYAFDYIAEVEWKIGRSQHWVGRFWEHQRFFGFDPTDRAIIVPVDCVVDAERFIHRHLAGHRLGLVERFRCSRREVITALDLVRGVE